MSHVFEVSLSHQSHVDLREELLLRRVDLGGLFQFLEVGEVVDDGFVCRFNQLILLVELGKIISDFFFLLSKQRLLVQTARVNLK